jgi:glucose/arabinose dehydrogenase
MVTYKILKPKLMKKIGKIGISIILLLNYSCSSAQNTETKTGSLSLPQGFSAIVVAEAFGQARHIAINTNGDIYVSLQRLKNGNGIVALRDTNNDGVADVIKYFGTLSGTGIGIHDGYLYFSSDIMIVRYKLRPQELLPDPDYEIVAKGFRKNYQHGAKSFTFDSEGNLYVNVGAPSNACQDPDRTFHTPGQDPCPLLTEFAGIWKFTAGKTNQDQMTDGYRYATGLRNCVALSWNPIANHLYALQHGRDQLHEFWPENYTEDDGVNLPSEEFFLIKDGGDYGWPYCYYNDLQNLKVLAPEYGGNGKIISRCTDKEKPMMGFPAHYAPNDLLFYTGEQFPSTYKSGAFIAFHGSWNRAPKEQKGYNVVFVPFEKDFPSGKWEVFADGFAGVAKIMSPKDALHRPCGLAQGPDGSLYVVEDIKGMIWKISYKK